MLGDDKAEEVLVEEALNRLMDEENLEDHLIGLVLIPAVEVIQEDLMVLEILVLQEEEMEKEVRGLFRVGGVLEDEVQKIDHLAVEEALAEETPVDLQVEGVLIDRVSEVEKYHIEDENRRHKS